MAFFGLTALGRQNPFSAASKFQSNLYIFLDKDFEDAWRKILPLLAIANEDDMSRIFRALYHGPPPEYDAFSIEDGFCGVFSGVSYSKYMEIMITLRNNAEQEDRNEYKRLGPAKTCDFSTQDALVHRQGTIRPLQEKIQYPLTSQQEVHIFHFPAKRLTI